MTRDDAVLRIKDGLSFRTGTSLDDKIVARLKEAQRDLESGKTLPRFLLLEDQPLSLVLGAHSVKLPTDFLRDDDDNLIHYTPTNTDIPFFLARKQKYSDVVQANIRSPNDPVGPKVYVIRNSIIDFVTTSDRAYTLVWNYYKLGTVLTSGSTANEWLNETPGQGAPEWLIGEAGIRIAANLHDKDAIEDFTNMRERGRAACFGNLIALEESGGPYVMGADN